MARHISTHAAGVVIADRRCATTCRSAKNGEDVITQWPDAELEEVGLLKMDFLGLKTLTILSARCATRAAARQARHRSRHAAARRPRKTYAAHDARRHAGRVPARIGGMRELLDAPETRHASRT
jgi:hypothetical protein